MPGPDFGLKYAGIRNFFFQEVLIHFDEMSCDHFGLDTHLTEYAFKLFAKRAKNLPGLTPAQAHANLHLVRNKKRETAEWYLREEL